MDSFGSCQLDDDASLYLPLQTMFVSHELCLIYCRDSLAFILSTASDLQYCNPFCWEAMSVSALLTISYVGLILRFDGSLRYPSDPGFPVDSLGRMAACAAAIVDDSCHDVSEHLMLAGGKLLHADSLWTSAQVEYEGLLLGLEGLSQVQQNQFSTCTTNAPQLKSTTTTVTVQGDCKTVMEQMRGRSRSRKLESYYGKATSMLRRLPFDFEFQRIPREKNCFCDRLCAEIQSEREMDALRMAQQDITEIDKVAFTEMNAKGSGKIESSRISDLIFRHFASLSSLITFSRRPALYREMACIAAEIRDSTGLIRIGEQLEMEVKTVWTLVKPSRIAQQAFALDSAEVTQDTNYRDRLLVEAIVYQLLGMRALGKEKQAAFLERKHRYLLKQFVEHVNTVEEWLFASGYVLGANAFESDSSDTDVAKLAEDDSDLQTQVQRWYTAATLSSSWKDEGVFWLNCSI